MAIFRPHFQNQYLLYLTLFIIFVVGATAGYHGGKILNKSHINRGYIAVYRKQINPITYPILGVERHGFDNHS